MSLRFGRSLEVSDLRRWRPIDMLGCHDGHCHISTSTFLYTSCMARFVTLLHFIQTGRVESCSLRAPIQLLPLRIFLSRQSPTYPGRSPIKGSSSSWPLTLVPSYQGARDPPPFGSPESFVWPKPISSSPRLANINLS